MNPLFRPARAALVLGCLTFALGCSGGKKVALASVTGKVTVDGQPLTSGQISFVPLSKDAAKAGLSSGTINSTGEYTIYTDGQAGAPLGNYRVTVSPSMVPTGDGKMPAVPFNRKYQDPANDELKKEVVASPEAGRYDLKLTK